MMPGAGRGVYRPPRAGRGKLRCSALGPPRAGRGKLRCSALGPPRRRGGSQQAAMPAAAATIPRGGPPGLRSSPARHPPWEPNPGSRCAPSGAAQSSWSSEYDAANSPLDHYLSTDTP
jgi:hypothetical protein